MNREHIAFIIDASGSMSGLTTVTKNNMREQFNVLRETETPRKKTYVTVTTFGNKSSYQFFRGADLTFAATFSRYPIQFLAKHQPITKINDTQIIDQYDPYGNTPLCDAIGETIEQIMKHYKEGDKVFFSIFTDGEENASQTHTWHSLKETISTLQCKGWIFSFVGADIDIDEMAKCSGINAGTIGTYSTQTFDVTYRSTNISVPGVQGAIGAQGAYFAAKSADDAAGIALAVTTSALRTYRHEE